MQLLRDNLTLWTSSESGDAEDSAAAPQKEEAKPAETKTEEAAPAAEESK